MPTKINFELTPQMLVRKIERLFELSGPKILSLEKSWKASQGTPVFTVKGKYTSRGWTEWTQGFQYGSASAQFDATGDERFLEIGRRRTVERMASHVSHTGVHDHGFNNISHLRKSVAADARGKNSHARRRKEFLRTGAEGFRRGAGGALDETRRWHGFHPQFQRAALVVCGHDPLAARRLLRPINSATC